MWVWQRAARQGRVSPCESVVPARVLLGCAWREGAVASLGPGVWRAALWVATYWPLDCVSVELWRVAAGGLTALPCSHFLPSES